MTETTITEQFQKSTLENGIRVLTGHVPGVRAVSVGVLVDVGPKNESPEERGFAHLVEHMLFQGTGMRDANAIAEMMEIGGGVMGAFTARDYTVYHATVLDEYLTFGLEVLGDMLCNSVIPEIALDRQREVILNEIAGSDDPLDRAHSLLKATLWPDHPLGYPTAGLEPIIRGVSRDRLVQFMAEHYVANKVILAASGNVEHDNFVLQARDSFWQMEAKPVKPPAGAPTHRLGVVAAEPRDVQQVYFTMAWPAPAYTDPARYAWHILASMLGGGITSRLYRRLREELGIVYHAGAQYHAYGNAGVLVVEGATSPQTLIPTLANIFIEMYKMGTEPIGPDDHHRTVQSLISQHLISGDSAYVRMSRLALQELYFKEVVPSQRVINALRLQSLDTIQQIAHQTATGGLPAMALVGPVSEPLLNMVGDMLSDFGDRPDLIYATQEASELVNA